MINDILNKNISIVLLLVLVVMSIACTFLVVSNNDNVYADEISYSYNLNNIIMPFAVTSSSQYDLFFNCYICFDLVIDFSRQVIIFNNPKLQFVEPSNPNYNYSQLPEFTTAISKVPFQLKFIYVNNDNVLPFSEIPHNSNEFENYKFTISLRGLSPTDGTYYEFFSKMSINMSTTSLSSINRCVITNYRGSDSSNPYLYNYLRYFDSNNNYLNISFPIFYLTNNNNNFPILATSYSNNLTFVESLTSILPIVYNTRTYFLSALTENDINQSSYDLGVSAGYIDGFKNGVNSVDTQSYIEQGKIIGYNQGVESVQKYTFFSLISAAVDAPVKAFTGLFDYEILGTNVKTFILSLLTLAIVLIALRIAIKWGD